MAERPSAKPEIGSQKLVLKLTPALGDWTTYRPQKILIKKVKTGLYGFDRLSKNELHLVLRIHYDFIQALLSRLKIDLKMGVEFHSCQVEQTTYLNFLRTLTGAAVQGKLALADRHEGIQLFVELGLANSIINHAMGSHDTEALNRGLTEAESAVFTTALSAYLPDYAAAFNNIFAPPDYTIISSPDVTLDPAINTSATFVSFSAEVALNDNPPGKIIFGYLASPLKALLKIYKERDRAKEINFSRFSPAILNKLMIPVTALLGTTSLFTSELHLLEVGDVVALEASINAAITMLVGNKFKAKAQPGIKHKKKAVRVAGFREEEELEITPPIEVKAEKPAIPSPPAPVSPQPIPAAEIPAAEELPKEEILEEEEEFPEEDFAEEEFLEEEEFPEEETNTGEV